MVICPNLKNPDVAREFNELKNATSEAAAYHIWSLNNGNGIDKAPNGAESKLFLTLLEYYNGDRTKAIQAKAKAYGTSFLNWFGDWTRNFDFDKYTEDLRELDKKHDTLLNKFLLDDGKSPISIDNGFGRRFNVDIQINGNVVNSQLLFPTDWFFGNLHNIKSKNVQNKALDDATSNTLKDNLSLIDSEILKYETELQRGTYYVEEIDEYFPLREDSKSFRRDRIKDLLLRKKDIEKRLEDDKKASYVSKKNIDEYRQTLYNLLFYLYSKGIEKAESEFLEHEHDNSMVSDDWITSKLILSNISKLLGNDAKKFFKTSYGKDVLEYDSDTEEGYNTAKIYVDVEGLLDYLKQNYKVSIKNDIINNITNIVSGKYRRSEEDVELAKTEIDKILKEKDELNKKLVDLKSTAVSKAVDENGEPLVVYHTTHPIYDPSFTIFNINITGKKSFIYTTDNLKMSESYAPNESRSKSTGKVVRKWNKEKAEKQIVKDEKAIQDLKDYIEKYNKSNNWKEFFNDQSIEESDFEDFSKQKKYETERAKNGIKNLEAEIYFLHDLINHPEKMQYTKALFVNSRTPIVIDAEGNWWNEINVHNGKEGVRQAKYMDDKKTYQRDVTHDYIVKHYGQNAFDNIFEYDIASVDDYLTEEDYEEINKIVNTKYPENYTFESTRTIESSIMENDNHDGMIIKNVKDYGPGAFYTGDNGTVIAVKEPNQVKSIDNQGNTPYEGTFSTENNDINYNLSTPSRAYAIRESLVNRGILHKFKGYRITKSNPYGEYAEDIIESECEKARIVPVFTRGKNSVEVDFLENTTIETGPKDEIERSNDTSQEAIKKVLAVLQKKVPWLKVKFISPSTIPSGVNKSANSFIKGDTVYLVKGRATTESTIEEFLHPIIYSIQVINNSLFLDLLYEAKHDFPKLWKEICRTYRNDIGFNENDRYNELVTQALSRYVHNDYRNANNKITVRDLVYKVFNFIARILNNAIQYVGGKAIITPENLTKLNLRQLSQLFMAEDSTFMIWTSSKILYNINSQQERAKKVSEDITNQFDILYKAYLRMPNKSPRRQRILNEIFEKFNELKRTLDYHAVSIAVNFALETLGKWNPRTNTPERNDSVSGYLYKQSLLPEPFSGITPDILVEMYTNSIAFYENLLNKYIPNNIDSMMTEDDRNKRDAVENLLKQYIKPMWIKAMCIVGDRIVDQNIDNEVTASDLDKENMKIVAKDWLHKNIMYGDIKGYAAYIFNNSYSKNPIIKLVFHMIQHAETKTLEETRPISTRITRAFLRANAGKRKIGPNWQTVLMEFNKDGIPTGNFVRDINYGQYEEDLTEFVKELNEEFIDKYNYTYVDDGTGVIINSLTGDLAENEEWGPNGEEPKYVEYLKRIEQWKCEHCNRRYTLDYYMERMSAPYRGSLDPNEVNLREFGHGLSPRTLSKYNYILTNINYYLNLCTDPNTGFSHPEKLSLVDKLKLDLWQEELEKIQNPYNKNGEPKSYEDRQIAFEIRAWQKWLGEHLTTTIDYEAFQEEYDKIRQEALDTNNPRLISDFFRYNSDVGINPDFIELTIGQFSKTYQSDPAVIHANLLKGSILRLVKTRNGYTRNFQEVENNPSFWLDCKRIDLTIEDLREKSSRDFAKELDEKFKFEKILYRDVNGFAQDSNGNQVLPQDEKNHKDLLTYLQHLINEYTKKILASSSRTLPGLNDRQGNPIVFNGTADDVKKTIGYLFSYTREYTDWEGNLIRQQVPLSILTMMLPKVETFHNTRTNRKERTIINIPKGRFAEKQDEGGRFINKDYDQSKHISEQPKREYYDNTDAWEKVESDSNLKRLYNVLIDEMKNAQKNYQAPGYNFNYRLPQVNANVMLIWSRIYKRGLGNTLQALYEAATTVEENDEAMRTTEDYITSPDGSVATDVPLKYVRKLKNPENITTDVVGSVILFANMAINYKNKCEIDADIKALRYNIDYNNRIDLYKVDKEAGGNDFVPQNDKNSIKMFDSMTNKHVYGNQWSIDPNQLQENKQAAKNAWMGVASSAIGFGSSTAALGALIGLPFGAPGSGAILGGLVGGVLGGLQGAAANGLFEGIALFKGIKNMQRIETTQTLALNMFSMLVGFGDSMTRIFKESLGGKYLTVRDAIVSFGSVLRYTPQCIANIGNPLANNKLTRAMQLNGISKGIRQIFEHMNYGKVRRVASNLLMGGFSMLDWMANALLLRAFYNNVRFYDGNVVPKGFYTSYELTQAFAKAGVKHPKKQAWLSHFVSGTTLWDAYDEYMNVRPEFAGYTGTIEDYKKLFHFVGTEDELKDEYEQYKKDHPVYVTQRLKTLIRTKTMKRGALYNGMNPDNDIPLWKQDIIGGIIGSLRAWLAQSTQHLIAGGIDNIVKEYKTDVEFKNVGTKTKSEETVKVLPMNNEQRSMAFAWDYETGMPLDQIITGIIRSFKTLSNKIRQLSFLGINVKSTQKDQTKAKFSYVEKYAWKDALIYLGVLAAMMFAWTFVHDWSGNVPPPKDRQHASPKSLYPQDVYDYFKDVYLPNEYYKLLVDNLVFRTIEAQLTNIDPTSTLDVLTSVSALQNGVEEHFGIIKPVWDIAGLSGHKIDEVINRGSYKFYTRGERALYKFVGPLDNLHTFFSYYGITENEKFYTNTYGHIYRAFGYEFKKNNKSKPKQQNQEDDYGFGGGFDSGFDGGFDSGF